MGAGFGGAGGAPKAGSAGTRSPQRDVTGEKRPGCVRTRVVLMETILVLNPLERLLRKGSL